MLPNSFHLFVRRLLCLAPVKGDVMPRIARISIVGIGRIGLCATWLVVSEIGPWSFASLAADDPKPVTSGTVKRETAEAVEAAKAYSAQERAQVEQKVQAELDELQAGIQRLQERMDQMSADTRRRAEASLEDLERRKDEARKRLEEIRIAGETTWDRLRQGLESSITDLRTRFRRLFGDDGS